ncbi:MAG: low molecular weight phosphotyrosine protein phosphatase [Ruminococcaceae bacterium]|nr:low molecular weight phosphotyrosine protein phosphatase [Oscillospiraceae bacterium]
MRKVLFVCHGNICRSPMAEFVLKDMLKKAGVTGVEVASVAVSTEELGNPVYPPARRELARHGIGCEGKRSRQITQKDVDSYGFIYYMDSNNLRWLNRMFPGQTKFMPFLDRNVADPWYTGDFTQTWADICLGCRQIFRELTGKEIDYE